MTNYRKWAKRQASRYSSMPGLVPIEVEVHSVHGVHKAIRWQRASAAKLMEKKGEAKIVTPKEAKQREEASYNQVHGQAAQAEGSRKMAKEAAMFAQQHAEKAMDTKNPRDVRQKAAEDAKGWAATAGEHAARVEKAFHEGSHHFSELRSPRLQEFAKDAHERLTADHWASQEHAKSAKAAAEKARVIP